MKLHFKHLMYLLLIIIFSNCSSSKKNVTNTNDSIQSKKTSSTLTNTYWKLIELNGKKIDAITADKKEIHLKFISDSNRVEGFGGCNGFGGNYTTKNDFNISITNVISTMIACPDLETENKLFKVLNTADNYYVKEDTLSLSKARMATIAKFVKQ